MDQRTYMENGTVDEREASAPSGKKPYQDPAFRHEKVFETLALNCSKVSPTQLMCRLANRKLS